MPDEPNETPEQETADAPAAPESSAPAARPTPTERREARRVARTSAAAAAPLTLEQKIEQRAAERKRKAAARSRRRVTERARARGRASTADAGAPAPAAAASAAGRPKVRQGIVVSSKPDKTIAVRIDTARRHMRYEKIVRSSSTLHAHDERNDANEGDTVRVIECRPLSRTKRWRLTEILERAK